MDVTAASTTPFGQSRSAQTRLSSAGGLAGSSAFDLRPTVDTAQTRKSTAPQPGVRSEGLDYYLTMTNIGISKEEFQAKSAEGGRKISLSQGLPEGHYDFSRLTRDEANVALNDIIVNQRAPQSVIDGLSVIANGLSNKPTNMLQAAKDGIDYEASQGQSSVAHFLKAALQYMTSEAALLPSSGSGSTGSVASIQALAARQAYAGQAVNLSSKPPT